MKSSYSDSYKAAGVDVVAGYRAVELMKEHVSRTHIPGVLSGLGGFGGLFELDLDGISRPVLVSGTDGVGTKLKLAFILDRHDTVGIDCVAMCVNDIVCCGAKPLVFLDYIALGKNVPEKVAQIVKGVSEGCVMAGCALIGGETAEMPGFYDDGEYDIAGFSTGVVDRGAIIDGEKIKDGDAIIGLASSGLHSNGFSLARHALLKEEKDALVYSDELSMTVGEALLTPTCIYVKSMLDLISKVEVKAVSHITGGGFYENIPRMLKESHSAHIKKGAIEPPPIFSLLQKAGKVPERDMYNTFNMGIGMMCVVDGALADRAVAILKENGEKAAIVGEIKAGEKGVEIW